MVASNDYEIEIIETAEFLRNVERLLDEEAIAGLKTYLAGRPESGCVISGTNGLRKLRWPLAGRGKSRGLRVLYYYRDLNMPLFVIAAYPKSQKENLSAAERHRYRELIDELLDVYAPKVEARWKGAVA